MASLNELCWDQILKHLSPLDWIRISEVYPAAKAASERAWKKFGTYVHVYDDHFAYDLIVPKVISVNDAQKILLQVSPVATLLILSFRGKSSTIYYIKFATVIYKVTDEGLDETLELVAVNAAELKTLELYNNIRLKAETIARLFSNNNNIRQVSVNQQAINDLCEKSVTGGIKNMYCSFDNKPSKFVLHSFEGHFQNLQTLMVNVMGDMESKEDLTDFLLKILPYTTNLKKFHFAMVGRPRTTINMMTDGLENIFNFSQLEDLKLRFHQIQAELVDEFCEKLVTDLPRLQVVRIGEFKLSDKAVLSLLSLPAIKIVSLGYNCSHWQNSGIIKSLETFSDMQRYRFDTQGDEFRDVISRCISDEVVAALSQGKKVVLNDNDNGRIAIIKKKSDRLTGEFSHEDTRLVDLISSGNDYSILEVLLEETKAYLEIHQKNCHVIIFKRDGFHKRGLAKVNLLSSRMRLPPQLIPAVNALGVQID